MKKYMWIGAVFLFFSALVTVQHQQHAQNAASVNGNWQGNGVPSSDAPETKTNGKESKWYSPGGDVAYSVLGWPNGITVWALIITMIAIAEQSYFTGVAAKATRESLVVGQSQIALAERQMDLMIEKDRAKLRIELSPFHPIPNADKGGCYVVNGAVSIYGTTDAFIESTTIYANIGTKVAERPLPEWSWGMHLGAVIAPETPPIPISTIVMAEEGPASDGEMDPIRDGVSFVYCCAEIKFSSLGRTWVLKLRRCFKPTWGMRTAKEEFFLGEWESDGMAWENAEYQQTPTPPLFRPKPN